MELFNDKKDMNKIIRELILFLQGDKAWGEAWEIQEFLGISERTYYHYVKELKLCQEAVEIIMQEKGSQLYDYQKACNMNNTYERHIERLKRLLLMIKIIEQLPVGIYGTREITIEEWNSKFYNFSPRTRQRDFQVLCEIGYRIYQREKKYHFMYKELTEIRK